MLVRPAATKLPPTANGSNPATREGGPANERPRDSTHSASTTVARVRRIALTMATSRSDTLAGSPNRSVIANVTVSRVHSTIRPSGRKLPRFRYCGTELTASPNSSHGRPR